MQHQHVRALIINDDKTVLIAGVPSECSAVAAALGCTPIPVPQGMCGHCKEVEPFKVGVRILKELTVQTCDPVGHRAHSRTRAPSRHDSSGVILKQDSSTPERYCCLCIVNEDQRYYLSPAQASRGPTAASLSRGCTATALIFRRR